MPSSARSVQSPHVRHATPADADAVFDILVAAHADNGVFSLDPERVRATIHHLTEHPIDPNTGKALDPLGLIAIIDAPKGGIAGIVILTLSRYWFSDEWLLDELVNFVRPEHRKSRHAQALINFAKETADRFGVPLNMTVLSTKRTAAKLKLYGRQMRQVGGSFMHGIERAHGPLALEARV